MAKKIQKTETWCEKATNLLSVLKTMATEDYRSFHSGLLASQLKTATTH